MQWRGNHRFLSKLISLQKNTVGKKLCTFLQIGIPDRVGCGDLVANKDGARQILLRRRAALKQDSEFSEIFSSSLYLRPDGRISSSDLVLKLESWPDDGPQT
jgi:hypothetical protein